MTKRLLLIICTALLVSCSLKLHEAEVELPSKYVYSKGYYIDNKPLSPCWWQSFNDPKLNEAIEQTLMHNRDLRAAVAALEASRHYVKVAQAEFLPSLNIGVNPEIVHEQKVTEQEYTIGPEIEWEISLFGELRNTKKAAAASFLAEEWSLRGVWLALSTQVATTYFTLLQYQRSLYIASRSYDLRCTATALVDSLYRYGMSNGTDLMQAKSLVYSARSEVEKYQRAVALTSLALVELLGENPKKVNRYEQGEALIDDSIPFDIPVGLPSTLLERRPDVMKSYYLMKQAAANVGISRAKRYPAIALTGSSGVYATSLSGLTSGNPLLWSAAAEITEPIFSWGALRRKELIARSKYEASVANYEQAVLTALSEVENALISIDTYSSQTAASTALVLANCKIAENTKALYSCGMGDYLGVIDAERELYASQIALIGMVSQQYINYVNLIKALGGGW